MIARAAAAALALLLGACAAVPPSPPLPQLAGVPAAFEMAGRLALRQGQRSEIAKLRWTHRPGSDVWVIASPLGNEVARIEAGNGRATLRQAGGESTEAASFAELTERLLGVALEPAMLAAWLHGRAPAEGAGEWRVTLEDKQPAGAIEIARRMSAERGDVVVRLVVDEYRALEP
ncbi:MAG TPA: outer membrane lipoprotein LolB [Usitatibacter sp.]|jgi:outer membrane biogenesis lipoprotein LolB|nr:outer membrane lipoprotein LolB [Usitatibacter sp.]